MMMLTQPTQLVRCLQGDTRTATGMVPIVPNIDKARTYCIAHTRLVQLVIVSVEHNLIFRILHQATSEYSICSSLAVH